MQRAQSAASRRDNDPLTENLILAYFDIENCSKPFAHRYCHRMGIRNPGDKNISFQISTTRKPLTTIRSRETFAKTEVALREGVYQAIAKVVTF